MAIAMQTPLQLRLQPRPPALAAARHRRLLPLRGFAPPRRGGWCRCCAGADAGKAQAQAQARRAYPYGEIEPRWQRHWEEHRTFRTPDIGDGLDTSKPKCYILDMFPYPSGAGLHVGHPLGYTATDILSRFKRMQGFNVLHPMGWDAFGLPAEQYAIETGTHPKITTERNIDRFRSQLKSLGFSYDWDREISTTEPTYYKWTQWIFLQLLKRGLAYQAEVPVNWCPALGTVLANEEVIDGVSERGGYPVIRKPMRQWMLRITSYADRLLEDLDELDWPESIKEMQRNWIGRSEGAELEFSAVDKEGHDLGANLLVYTTRPDTIFGATYLVLAPEHSLLPYLTSEEQRVNVEEYIELAARKSELERTDLQKEKTGVFSGSYAKNPATGEIIPIWVADYVLGSYGTGAIMAVPAHDSRDHEFALKYKLPIIKVVSPPNSNFDSEEAYADDGIMINSSSSSSGLNINGMLSKDAALKVTEWVEANGFGKKKVNYKLRDWLFARQRYWGEPFPVIYRDDTNEMVPLQENQLPLTLPELDDFTPTGTGEPPLTKATDWVKTIEPLSGKPASRETSTMPQWAGSCWYYLRFMDPQNASMLVDKAKESYWGPVDIYVGGAEHSVLHLLYARFWHKVLYDIGVVSTKEPFKCLINQGLILGEVEYTAYRDNEGRWVSADSDSSLINCYQEKVPAHKVTKVGDHYVLKDDANIRLNARAYKMSKSRGNVINPDDVVSEYGADSLRLYEMFMGPLRDSKTWSTGGIEGVHRFLGRTWRLIVGTPLPDGSYGAGTTVTDEEPTLDQLRVLHKCIARVTEEIQETRFNTAISAMMEFVNAAYKAKIEYLKESKLVLPVQINGKTRGCILVLVTLVTVFMHYAVPLHTLSLLISVDPASSVIMEEGKIWTHNSGPSMCDFSSPRSDVCKLKGDVRVMLHNATVVVGHPSGKHQSWRMKPHPRKNDPHALAGATEVSVTLTPAAELVPECSAKHAAPAVVFSVGGYAGNMFHDFTDVLVPLYITTRRFAGDVHLLVSDAQPWWLEKYSPLLRELSRRDIVDMDRGSTSGGVHCYPQVIVGLEFHKEMSVDAAKIAGGYSMADFARLIRRSYGLTRDTAIRLRDGDNTGGIKEKKNPHPRLLIISRKATRAFTNVGAIARAAAALGYEVVVGETDHHSDLGVFAATVNSCDVVVGVHGAGLTNLVFLPAGAVVVQVVPLGGLEKMAREDFGVPAGDIGLRYVQYDIAVEESTLARQYPRDHRVLSDPAAVRRDGWLALRSAYLVGQNVTLDVARFVAALSRALHLLRE
ncbi:hypothetical protein E2562_023523 [Oryza meyeriana var. granulata]|uniref:leucine--tRNA ligase n=1 Tax=Oryza meyeriana var. granulata TaxID=110450 RepID=A0A6G1E0P3_9ORYZ|nr:hypothetical protein E2562_023523 [Oryza meyeriana var. granulata]